MEPMRLSLVQMNSRVGEAGDNLVKMERFIEEASSEGSDLVCFPECSLTGYTSEDPWRFALPEDDPAVRRLVGRSADLGVCVSFGLMESVPGGRPRIMQMLVDPSGGMACYRKTHLGSTEADAFAAGQEFRVADAGKALVGVMLCWESHIPDIATVLRGRGADVILVPYSCGSSGERRRSSWMKFLPARALDNGLFVAACNAVGDNGLGKEMGGGMVVIGPRGDVLAEYYGKEEEILTVDLDGKLPRDDPNGRMDSISFYDRRRPELYL